jgi:RimJ/RimL family protein N-acetyltransferase
MPKITLRPSIPADLSHVVGEPLPCRIRAITALADDRVIGLGGVAFPPDGPAIAFVQLAPAPGGSGGPEARRYPVAFHRAGLRAMEMIRTSGIAQVIATADAGNAAAVRWLKRLGFTPSERQPIAGRILFVWTNGPQRQSG